MGRFVFAAVLAAGRGAVLDADVAAAEAVARIAREFATDTTPAFVVETGR